MGNEGEQRVGDGSTDGEQHVGLTEKIRKTGLRAVNRYQKLPSWALLPQVFLAAGWGRAAVAHALSRRWWNGEEILEFLETDTELHVGLYGPVLRWIVEPFPVATAVVVVLAELFIAILLIANYRIKAALTIAAFLNVQFMLAGVVNPSIFYLVVSLGIAIWRLETLASPETVTRLTRVGLRLAFGASLFLAPSVRTIEPEAAIEDPALVLIFFIALSAASLWWVRHRMALAGETLAALTGDDRRDSEPRKRPISLAWLAAAAVATVAILAIGFVEFGEGEVQEVEAGPEPAGPGLQSTDLGSLHHPYAVGQDVTLSYNDLETGALRQWQVRVVDALLLNGDRLGLTPPTDDSRLAMARVALSFPALDGPEVDLKFSILDQSDKPIPERTEGCGERTPLLPEDLDTSTSGRTEGWVCWWVSATDLRSLLVAIEAEPADGIVYLSLVEEEEADAASS